MKQIISESDPPCLWDRIEISTENVSILISVLKQLNVYLTDKNGKWKSNMTYTSIQQREILLSMICVLLQ